jgi:hypothetical protein
MINEDWDIQPTNVDVDGEIIAMPTMDALTRITVILVVDHQTTTPPATDIHDIKKWAKSLSKKGMEAAYRYFLDRWTWDSGSECDRFMHHIMDAERNRRNDMAKSMAEVLTSVNFRGSIEECLEAFNTGRAGDDLIDRMLETGKSVNTSVTPETTDDANSKPSKPDNTDHDCQEHEQ